MAMGLNGRFKVEYNLLFITSLERNCGDMKADDKPQSLLDDFLGDRGVVHCEVNISL